MEIHQPTKEKNKPYRNNHYSTWPTNTSNNLTSFQKANKIGLTNKCSPLKNGVLSIPIVGLEKPSPFYVSITKRGTHHNKKKYSWAYPHLPKQKHKTEEFITFTKFLHPKYSNEEFPPQYIAFIKRDSATTTFPL